MLNKTKNAKILGECQTNNVIVADSRSTNYPQVLNIDKYPKKFNSKYFGGQYSGGQLIENIQRCFAWCLDAIGYFLVEVSKMQFCITALFSKL